MSRRSAIRRGFVRSPAGQIHYREAGGGEPVVFLHMTPGSSRIYEGMLPLVGEHYRAIAMDTMGYGDSEPLGEADLETYAASVTWLLDGLGIDRAILFGLSTGSVIAGAVAIHHPERVSRLVLCEAGRFNTPERQQKQRAGLKWELDPSGEYFMQQWLTISRGFGGRLTPEQAYILYVDSLKAGSHAHEAYRALVFYDFVGKLDRIRIPTLLLYGEHSTREEPPQTFVDGIAGSTLLLIPAAANAGPLEQPEATARILLDWLREGQGARVEV